MAFTTTQLDAIEAAIASGELVIEYEGKKVQYRNMDDLVTARNTIRADLIARGELTPTAAPTLSFARRVRS